MSRETHTPPLPDEKSGTSVQSDPAQGSDPAGAERVIAQMQRELHSLLLEQAAIQRRIGVIKSTVVGLSDVFGPKVLSGELRDLLFTRSMGRSSRANPGLTNVCRQVLRESSQPLTVRQVCGVVQEKYPSVVAGHKNATASLLVVLRRLVSYGEVEARLTEKGGRIWLWAAERHEQQI